MSLLGAWLAVGRLRVSTLTPSLLLPLFAQKKNPKKLLSKLEFLKYDPRVMRHVLFTETKLK